MKTLRRKYCAPQYRSDFWRGNIGVLKDSKIDPDQ